MDRSARPPRPTRRAFLRGLALGGAAFAIGSVTRPALAWEDEVGPGGDTWAQEPAADPTATLPPPATPTAAAPAAAPPPQASPTPTATPWAPPAAYSTDLLVDANWVVDRMVDPRMKLVELGESYAYGAGHIPSAGLLTWPELLLADSSPATLAAWQAEMAQRLGGLGIVADDTVVVYDGGSLWAARVWWILEALGHRDKRILDGGKAAWVQAGNPLSVAPATAGSAPYVARPDDAALAGADYIVSRLGAPDLVLVDARDADEYAGLNPDGTVRGGHIPGAVNIPYTALGTADQPRYYHSPDTLAALYAAQGVTPDKEVIAYCSTGVRSAVTYYSLRLLGYPRVRLYSASWREWGDRPDLPIEPLPPTPTPTASPPTATATAPTSDAPDATPAAATAAPPAPPTSAPPADTTTPTPGT